MKIDFQNLNISPTPNPKPINVERVAVRIDKSETAGITSTYGFIRNASVHPDAHTGRN